jgi:hypothetical protein
MTAAAPQPPLGVTRVSRFRRKDGTRHLALWGTVPRTPQRPVRLGASRPESAASWPESECPAQTTTVSLPELCRVSSRESPRMGRDTPSRLRTRRNRSTSLTWALRSRSGTEATPAKCRLAASIVAARQTRVIVGGKQRVRGCGVGWPALAWMAPVEAVACEHASPRTARRVCTPPIACCPARTSRV